MYITDINKKVDDCYECSSLISRVYWDSSSKDFLRLYKEYTEEDYPVFAKIGTKNIITEKPIEEIKKELKLNLENLSKQKHDKRIKRFKSNINFIMMGLENNEIDKDFMSGKKYKTMRDTYNTTWFTAYNPVRYMPYEWDFKWDSPIIEEIFTSSIDQD